jgi:hypothetical protein
MINYLKKNFIDFFEHLMYSNRDLDKKVTRNYDEDDLIESVKS